MGKAKKPAADEEHNFPSEVFGILPKDLSLLSEVDFRCSWRVPSSI
jgi:hypothetical protein